MLWEDQIFHSEIKSVRLDQCFLSKQSTTHPGSPHILPLTLKWFFIFLESVQEFGQRFRAQGGSQEAPLLFQQQEQHSPAQGNACLGFLRNNSLLISLAVSSGLTGGLAAPLVAAGAATIIGSAGAAALGSTAGIAVMASLFGAAGAGLTGKRVTTSFSATGAQDCVCTHS